MEDLGIALCLSGLCVEDIRKCKIPLWITLLFCLAGIVYGMWKNGTGQCLTGMLPGILLLFVALVLPGQIGTGDAILAIGYGGFYGWKRACLWLVFSFLLAAVIGLATCVIRKRERVSMPFVPFLTIVHVGMCL